MEDRHLVNAQIYYPGELILELDKPIQLRYEGKLNEIKITKHFKLTEIRDFRNSIEIDKEEAKFEGRYELDSTWQINNTGGYSYGVKNDAYRLVMLNNSAYTELILTYSCHLHDQVKSKKYILGVLNQFILSYRLSTGDYTIQLAHEKTKKQILINEYQTKFEDFQKEYSEDKKLRILQQYGHAYKPFNTFTAGSTANNFDHGHIDEKETTKKLKAYLINHEYDLGTELLNKAMEYLYLDHNYNAAFLNAFISIEVYVSRFVEKFYSDRKISNKKIKAYKKEAGMAYKLNIILPIIFGEPSDDHLEKIHDADKIRSKRNKLVHEGLQVDFEGAKFATNTAINLISIIEDHETN